ncbi:MAG: glycosyltransferase [Candidatus Acidiferrum sp.]
MTEPCVAVLGWRDEPTDAVEEYCQYLGAALSKYDIDLKTVRVRWREEGWQKGVKELTDRIRSSDITWFLVQYTALGWSRRGFPLRVLRVVSAIKKSRKRCAVVFHDPAPYPGERLADRFRRMVQSYVMRKLVQLADLAIVTVPLEVVSWLPRNACNVHFIPVGANLPCPETAWELNERRKTDIPSIAVFSITGGAAADFEVSRIADALSVVVDELGTTRLLLFGRNSDIEGKKLEQALAGKQVELEIHGLLKAEQIVEALGRSDVMLFVRGPISTRRGSALAGLACGLPIVATEGEETAGPIKEAGIVLVAQNSGGEFGRALVRVLRDEAYRRSLQERSKLAQKRYFSWAAIASKYAALLGKSE